MPRVPAMAAGCGAAQQGGFGEFLHATSGVTSQAGGGDEAGWFHWSTATMVSSGYISRCVWRASSSLAAYTVRATWSPSAPSLMTMKTSCNSPPQWSKGEQHFSTPAATKAFAWLVSSETACAIWFVLDPKWVSVTRVLRFGVVRYVFQQRLEVTGKYIHRLETVSI